MNHYVVTVPARIKRVMEKSFGSGFSGRDCYRVPVSIAVFAMASILSFPRAALAQGAGVSPATMLTSICTFILGPFGESLAVLGIIAIGLAWMFGRASLGLIAGVIGGIVIMFGASFLGSTLTGTGG